MKILGVGLSRTGTTSLHQAFQLLGFNCLHHDTYRLNDILAGANSAPNFRRYDDVEAVTDLPTAYFYRELLAAYPHCKAILTVRDVEAWWHSILRHYQQHPARKPDPLSPIAHRLKLHWWPGKRRFEYFSLITHLRNYVYGSYVPHEFLYKKRFLEHNRRVQCEIPNDKLLVMNITTGDGWDVLCPFLGVDIPSVPFPNENQGRRL